MSFYIKRYSASGVWSGEVVSEFESKDEAFKRIAEITDRRIKACYNVDVDTDDDTGEVTGIEVYHDDEADNSRYRIYEEL